MDVLICDRCGTGLPRDASACSVCSSPELTRRMYLDDTVSIGLTATTNIDLRMSLTAVFLRSAAMSVRDAYTIQVVIGTERKDNLVLEHQRSVLTAVMLSAAALEAEVFEVVNHGAGHHLGTNGIDRAGKELLAARAAEIERLPTLERYETILQLLGKQAIERGRSIWQNADLAMGLRNEFVHYKSKWSSQLEHAKWLKALRSKRHQPPPFVALSSSFFPDQCLSADCARWCVESLAQFLETFYKNVGIDSPLKPFESSFLFQR